MRRIILVLAMLALLAITALPAMAQGSGHWWDSANNPRWDDNNWRVRGNDRDDNDWWNRGNNPGLRSAPLAQQQLSPCDWYWSWFEGWTYWCWSPWYGWYQLW